MSPSDRPAGQSEGEYAAVSNEELAYRLEIQVPDYARDGTSPMAESDRLRMEVARRLRRAGSEAEDGR